MSDDRKLAAAAVRKRQKGEKPNRAEAAALRRVEKARDAELAEKHYGAVPKKLWVTWSGRQYKLLAEVAARYGAPLSGRTISMPEFVAWFHDWIATNGPKLPAAGEKQVAAIEKVREEQAKIRKLERLRLEGELVAVAEIRRGMDAFAMHIQRAGKIMEKRPDMTGLEAARELRRGLENARREFTACLPADDGISAQPG